MKRSKHMSPLHQTPCQQTSQTKLIKELYYIVNTESIIKCDLAQFALNDLGVDWTKPYDPSQTTQRPIPRKTSLTSHHSTPVTGGIKIM